MAEQFYNKLVRDNIPDLIREDGDIPVIRTLNDEDYAACLREKLREEVEEFLKESNLDELSDILEVLDALSNLQGWTDSEIQRVRRDKAERRGVFRERIFLEKVIRASEDADIS